jgi:hypothetical protein
MKKMLIGALVGGLIIFIWQFISFAAVNFHKSSQQYTDKQDAILNFLGSQGLAEGGYVLPSLPEGSSMEEYETQMKTAEGKPWATIQYHSSMENNMVMNMIRGLLVNIVAVFLFCWMVTKMENINFGTVMASALVLGLIIFFNAPYVNHIWYQSFDIWAHFMDYLVSWGLTGAWLGWWFTRNTKKASAVRTRENTVEMA